VPTLVLDPQPQELAALIERRRLLGQDLLDEVWEGVLHLNPAPHGRHSHLQQQLAELLGPLARPPGWCRGGHIFNLGDAEDYRVPDGGLLRPGPDAVYLSTAALVIEIVSPGDESWNKLPFYAAHAVAEVLIVDPQTRSIDLLALGERGEYTRAAHSSVIELTRDALAGQIDWA